MGRRPLWAVRSTGHQLLDRPPIALLGRRRIVQTLPFRHPSQTATGVLRVNSAATVRRKDPSTDEAIVNRLEPRAAAIWSPVSGSERVPDRSPRRRRRLAILCVGGNRGNLRPLRGERPGQLDHRGGVSGRRASATLRLGARWTEFESPDVDDVNMFVSLFVQGFDCDGTFIFDRGTGEAVYTGDPSLQNASVSGTIDLNDGSVASIDVQWSGTGPLETTVNQTQFPSFVSVFTNRERDATATGTVIVDGVTIVSGPSRSADIETLEDKYRTLPSGDG
jgi:hypothetical protein